jgi:hypothetical protein
MTGAGRLLALALVGMGAALALRERKKDAAPAAPPKRAHALAPWPDPYGPGWEHSQSFWCEHRVVALENREQPWTPYQRLQHGWCSGYINVYYETKGRPPPYWRLPDWLGKWT